MMKSIDKIEFESNINRDNGFENKSLGVLKSSMELFQNEEDPDQFYIEWDVPELEDTYNIGIWTDNESLIDYDGVFELPKEAIELLEKNKIEVSEEFKNY